ncbi:MAG: Asp-tRNA(Asn)/Glu-tRNA(Gln) amidotransferase subunit GatC [candidate division WOR-3 bacterium]
MIDINELEKIAHLARIGLKPDELENLASDIEKIVKYFQKLKEVSLVNVLPMTHTVDKTLELRPDMVKETNVSIDDFPYVKFRYFYVPSILD